MPRETLVSDAKRKKQGKDKSDFCFAVVRGAEHVLTIWLEIWYAKRVLSEGVLCCESAAVCMGGWFGWEICMGDLYVGKERGKSEEERAEEVGG